MSTTNSRLPPIATFRQNHLASSVARHRPGRMHHHRHCTEKTSKAVLATDDASTSQAYNYLCPSSWTISTTRSPHSLHHHQPPDPSIGGSGDDLSCSNQLIDVLSSSRVGKRHPVDSLAVADASRHPPSQSDTIAGQSRSGDDLSCSNQLIDVLSSSRVGKRHPVDSLTVADAIRHPPSQPDAVAGQSCTRKTTRVAKQTKKVSTNSSNIDKPCSTTSTTSNQQQRQPESALEYELAIDRARVKPYVCHLCTRQRRAYTQLGALHNHMASLHPEARVESRRGSAKRRATTTTSTSSEQISSTKTTTDHTVPMHSTTPCSTTSVPSINDNTTSLSSTTNQHSPERHPFLTSSPPYQLVSVDRGDGDGAKINALVNLLPPKHVTYSSSISSPSSLPIDPGQLMISSASSKPIIVSNIGRSSAPGLPVVPADGSDSPYLHLVPVTYQSDLIPSQSTAATFNPALRPNQSHYVLICSSSSNPITTNESIILNHHVHSPKHLMIEPSSARPIASAPMNADKTMTQCSTDCQEIVIDNSTSTSVVTAVPSTNHHPRPVDLCTQQGVCLQVVPTERVSRDMLDKWCVHLTASGELLVWTASAANNLRSMHRIVGQPSFRPDNASLSRRLSADRLPLRLGIEEASLLLSLSLIDGLVRSTPVSQLEAPSENQLDQFTQDQRLSLAEAHERYRIRRRSQMKAYYQQIVNGAAIREERRLRRTNEADSSQKDEGGGEHLSVRKRRRLARAQSTTGSKKLHRHSTSPNDSIITDGQDLSPIDYSVLDAHLTGSNTDDPKSLPQHDQLPIAQHQPRPTPKQWLRTGERNLILLPSQVRDRGFLAIVDWLIELINETELFGNNLDSSLQGAAVQSRQLIKARCLVFANLWANSIDNFITTSSSKMGADFLVYPGDPLVNHATKLVVVVMQDGEDDQDSSNPSPTPLLAAKLRVADSVRKQLVLARLQSDLDTTSGDHPLASIDTIRQLSSSGLSPSSTDALISYQPIARRYERRKAFVVRR